MKPSHASVRYTTWRSETQDYTVAIPYCTVRPVQETQSYCVPITTYRTEVDYVPQQRVRYVAEPVEVERVEKVCTGHVRNR